MALTIPRWEDCYVENIVTDRVSDRPFLTRGNRVGGRGVHSVVKIEAPRALRALQMKPTGATEAKAEVALNIYKSFLF